MNFREELDKRVNYIEAIIKEYLPEEEGYQKRIYEAMNYSILAGGKRLRPMLMLETYRLFGGCEEEEIKPFMAAIEMIHTYSLVHDDLPAMDNDEYRRGRKTTHIVFGEAMGILAGDGLLNYAFETACLALKGGSYENLKCAAAALSILAKKAGIYGMIGGQVVDMEGFGTLNESNMHLNKNENEVPLSDFHTNHKSILDKLNYMYRLKTGALIEASMMIGAVLAGADAKEVLTVEQMASDIGLAFQIEDDILDVTSTTEIMGKPAHSDEKNNKVTYVTLLGINKAKEEVAALSERGISAFQTLKKENQFLQDLIIDLINRKK
ncbi:polyprenyl synthetase family protein [Anaerocolumna sedimenticola]|uniref:Polyprenyl synthetase family protein n=1 Tax=Anaerocolumna sedimenticola TaxID=2696063 RepID=A0A6P1TWF3_9FIRM|nr:polyprenyl synthetase family protein [Anaerocolumna sedimenticola]QHQ63838.1 polyprenyl synthetase family protein [Anaerocolumna sedimenticola]